MEYPHKEKEAITDPQLDPEIGLERTPGKPKRSQKIIQEERDHLHQPREG
jgi:hypothetical protein